MNPHPHSPSAAGLVLLLAGSLCCACQSGAKRSSSASVPSTGPLTVKQAMDRMTDNDYEVLLDKVANGKAARADDIGSTIVATFERIDWSSHDALRAHTAEAQALAADVKKAASAMAAAAKAGRADDVKKLARETLDSCEGCHVQYRPAK